MERSSAFVILRRRFPKQKTGKSFSSSSSTPLTAHWPAQRNRVRCNAHPFFFLFLLQNPPGNNEKEEDSFPQEQQQHQEDSQLAGLFCSPSKRIWRRDKFIGEKEVRLVVNFKNARFRAVGGGGAGGLQRRRGCRGGRRGCPRPGLHAVVCRGGIPPSGGAARQKQRDRRKSQFHQRHQPGEGFTIFYYYLRLTISFNFSFRPAGPTLRWSQRRGSPTKSR